MRRGNRSACSSLRRRFWARCCSTAVDDPQDPARLAAFAQGLQELGWTIGRNLRIDYRWSASSPDNAHKYAEGTSRMSVTYQQGLLTLQRKRTGGNQHVTVTHIHQQVNVTEGGQAVVAGETVTRGPGERRRGMIEK
jgi:hypothetical protein